MASDLMEWVCRTNEAMELRLVRPQDNDESSEPTAFYSFHPTFTYPIFGENEAVFGYKNLSIKFSYTAGSLRLYPRIDYDAKYKARSIAIPTSSTDTSSEQQTNVSADNVKAILANYLPKNCIGNYDDFIRAVGQDAETFRPIGEKIHEYEMESKDGELEHFEIYYSTFANEAFREYHARFQLFILLFIEGSSFIEDDDENWEIYTVFQRIQNGDKARYDFIGYTTTYPFFCWPEHTRMRISQFLILPPFQQQGHGSELYRTIYQIFMTRNDVRQITVEDPNDEFSDMRDKNDMRYLKDRHAFDGLTAPVSPKQINALVKKFKLTERQTQRCVEMYLLSKLNKLNAADYKAYRLQVKNRLYLFNIDDLEGLDPQERKEKLQQTYESVEEDYHRLLEII